MILLAFADAVSAGEGARLRLRAEQRAIEAALSDLAAERIRVVSFATRKGLFDALDRENDRIVAVHFGGHGDWERCRRHC